MHIQRRHVRLHRMDGAEGLFLLWRAHTRLRTCLRGSVPCSEMQVALIPDKHSVKSEQLLLLVDCLKLYLPG